MIQPLDSTHTPQTFHLISNHVGKNERVGTLSITNDVLVLEVGESALKGILRTFVITSSASILDSRLEYKVDVAVTMHIRIKCMAKAGIVCYLAKCKWNHGTLDA